MANGFDRNNYADNQGRPDIGNPNAPLNTRAIISTSCRTGYQNPDTLACVTPSDVHWVEGIGFRNASTVGRNTLRTGGTNNFDLNLTKSIPIGETRRLELRWEALNALNFLPYQSQRRSSQRSPGKEQCRDRPHHVALARYKRAIGRWARTV